MATLKEYKVKISFQGLCKASKDLVKAIENLNKAFNRLDPTSKSILRMVFDTKTNYEATICDDFDIKSLSDKELENIAAGKKKSNRAKK